MGVALAISSSTALAVLSGTIGRVGGWLRPADASTGARCWDRAASAPAISCCYQTRSSNPLRMLMPRQ